MSTSTKHDPKLFGRWANTFDELAHRFEGLEAESAKTGIRRLGAQAARLMKMAKDADAGGLFSQDFPFPEASVNSLLEDDTRLWSMTWSLIAEFLSLAVPHYVPRDFGLKQWRPMEKRAQGRFLLTIPQEKTGAKLPTDWREIARDHAAACRFLARELRATAELEPPTAIQGGAKDARGRRGRPRKVKPDKVDEVVKRIRDLGEAERYGWKELRSRYAAELPKRCTPDALRMRFTRSFKANSK